MKLYTIATGIAMALASACCFAEPVDRDLRWEPIDAKELIQQIRSTPIESKKHDLLIQRAHVSGLLHIAFEEYQKLRDVHQGQIWADVWLAVCGMRYQRRTDARGSGIFSAPQPPLGKEWTEYHGFKMDQLLEDTFKAAQQKLGSHPLFLRLRAEYLGHTGLARKGEVIDLLRRSAHLDPSDADTWYSLASKMYADYIMERMKTKKDSPGRLREIEAAARRAVSLDPSHFSAHCTLTYALYEQKRYKEALQVAERAVTLVPNLQKVAPLTHRGITGMVDWLRKQVEAGR